MQHISLYSEICVTSLFSVQRWLTDQKSECPHCRAPLLVSQLVSCRFISEISLVIFRHVIHFFAMECIELPHPILLMKDNF